MIFNLSGTNKFTPLCSTSTKVQNQPFSSFKESLTKYLYQGLVRASTRLFFKPWWNTKYLGWFSIERNLMQFIFIISNINIVVFIWSTHSSSVHSILSCQLMFTNLVLKFLIFYIYRMKQQVDNLSLPYAHDMWKQNICIDDLYLLRINYFLVNGFHGALHESFGTTLAIQDIKGGSCKKIHWNN